jgi:hypothetical protein
MPHAYLISRDHASGNLPDEDMIAVRRMIAVVVADLGWSATTTRRCLDAAAAILGMHPRRCRGWYHGEIRRLLPGEYYTVRSAFERHLHVQAAAFERRQSRLRRQFLEIADG